MDQMQLKSWKWNWETPQVTETTIANKCQHRLTRREGEGNEEEERGDLRQPTMPNSIMSNTARMACAIVSLPKLPRAIMMCFVFVFFG